ncbi:MAG: FHA domain-containing protein [Myxococcales bacterium]|nr:FHA domain-containing protein [Myxococcales bacterium]
MATNLLIRVHRAPEASALKPGMTMAVKGRVATVGRDPASDVVLFDRTVSREHLRIDVGPPLQVTALTGQNGTFLDRVALPVGEAMPVPEGARLQLGGVVVGLMTLGDTEHVRRQRLPDVADQAPLAASAPLMEVRWDSGQCQVRCGGRDVGLTGAAARFLGRLADDPGQVVHRDDLCDDLKTTHFPPLASKARSALELAARSGAVDLDLIRERLRAAGVSTDDIDPNAPTKLMRALISNRRDHGYVLHLTRADIVVEHV